MIYNIWDPATYDKIPYLSVPHWVLARWDLERREGTFDHLC